jgi:hypothetical protein
MARDAGLIRPCEAVGRAFFAIGVAFGLGYGRRPGLTLIALILFSGAIEIVRFLCRAAMRGSVILSWTRWRLLTATAAIAGAGRQLGHCKSKAGPDRGETLRLALQGRFILAARCATKCFVYSV